MFFLQAQAIGQNPEISKASDYFPIGIQLLFALGLVTVMIAGSHFLGPKRKTSDKLQVFESGIEQFGMPASPWPSSISSWRFYLCCLMWK